jgi:hypothetical protein
MAGRHARSRKTPSSVPSAIPIIPKAQVPSRPPEHFCKNSSANLETNFGTIRFRLSTRENFQCYPAQKISLTTTYSLSRSKIAGNSSLSTKESTLGYCKEAFLLIMLLKTILECKNSRILLKLPLLFVSKNLFLFEIALPPSANRARSTFFRAFTI